MDYMGVNTGMMLKLKQYCISQRYCRNCKMYEFCHKYLKDKPEDMDNKILEDFDFFFTFRFGKTEMIIPEGSYDDSL